MSNHPQIRYLPEQKKAIPSVTLPNVYQLLENAFEHSLFPCLMESRINGKHPVFGDGRFFSLLRH